MAEWIPPRSWITGETVTAAWWTVIGRNLRELKNLARVHCYHSQDEELKSGEWECLKWDSDALDNAGLHDNHRTKQYGSPASSSKHGSRDGKWPDTSEKKSSRVTVDDDALYLVIFKVNFEANSTGNRKLMLRKNSSENPGSGHNLGSWSYDATSSGESVTWGERVVPLEAGDHIELFAWQDSGGLLNVSAGKAGTFFQVAQLTY